MGVYLAVVASAMAVFPATAAPTRTANILIYFTYFILFLNDSQRYGLYSFYISIPFIS